MSITKINYYETEQAHEYTNIRITNSYEFEYHMSYCLLVSHSMRLGSVVQEEPNNNVQYCLGLKYLILN